ncbi:calcineurin-like phosphoesterase family protein [Acidovorax sp. RAC01]|nr:calcineurin-like phosphoesterase family protein [Acidovorax sp. RAC01]
MMQAVTTYAAAPPPNELAPPPAAPAAPAGAQPLALPCGTALWLLPQRAVWWPAERMVLVADVHFGKAATFRRAGQPVPHGTTGDNLARLDALLRATGAQHLVFLGDFLHARSGAADALWQQLQPWREQHAAVRMTLVRGNHDAHAGDPPAAMGIELANEPWAPVDGIPVLACHHPQKADGATVLAGHLHPTVTLRGMARDRLRLPCFAWSPGLLVLPAFGAFTGTSSVPLTPDARCFAVAADRVCPVPPA